MANVQENVILHFYFGKTCAKTWNFSLPKKLDLRKTNIFRDWPSSFCSTYTNMCDTTKKMEYSWSLYNVVSGHHSVWAFTSPFCLNIPNLKFFLC
jgi:hypothetical protein